MFHKQAHRVGFVHQAQFSRFGWVAFVLWIHEYAAAHQDAVDFGNHAGYPAHIVVFAAYAGFACQQFVNVLLNRGKPMSLVGHIDGEFFSGFGNARIFFGQQELVGIVQSEDKYAVTDSQYQLGLRTV